MTVTTKTNLQDLYEIDDYLWLEETINLLKQKKFNELDLENLIEELESLVRRDKLAIRSLLEQIIRHLLLLEYWDSEYERNANHWEAEIFSFRRQLKRVLTTNFRNYLYQELPDIYDDAVGYVIRKTGMNIFPSKCLYNLEQLLDEN
jgi:Domain of unknown function DUF29